jgi:transcriptional regulator with XRE-family HTH domain
MLTWNELQERLGVSESMLYFMRTGARNPSPKMLRRIMELETEAGISQPVPSPMMVRETPGVYSVTRPAKHLNIVDLKHDLEQIEALARALRAKLEEVKHADDG